MNTHTHTHTHTHTAYKPLLSLIFFFTIIGKIYAAGPCSSYQPQGSCSPPCDGSCTYYTFTPNSKSKTIRKIPYELSQFKPAGNYCDLQGESQLNSTLRGLPYNLAGIRIGRMPQTVTLGYQKL